MADQWDCLHRRYSRRLSSRRQSSAKARSSGANSAHSLGRGGKSGSFAASFPSSGDSTPSLPDESLPGSGLNAGKELSRFDDSFDEDAATAAANATVVPSYISVERKVSLNPSKAELSESDIVDPEILVPRKKSLPETPVKPSHLHGDALRSPEAPAPVSTAVQVPRGNASEHQYDNYKPRVLGSTPPDSRSKVMDAIVFLANPTSEYDSCIRRSGDKGEGISPTKTVDISARYETASSHHMITVPQETTPSDSSHEYANVEFGKNLPAGLQAALNKGAALSKGAAAAKSSPSPNSAKKPMPIQRKRNQSEAEEKEAPSKSPPQNRLNNATPKKPLPPAKPLRLQSNDDSGLVQSPEGVVVGGVGSDPKETREHVAAVMPVLVKTRPHSSSLTETSASSEEPEEELSYSLGASKPRSYTNVDQRPDLKKREALLPPVSSSPASNLVVFGQLKLDSAPLVFSSKPQDSRDAGHAQVKDVTPPQSSSRDPQPQRSKVNVITKPLPPSKARVHSQPPATASSTSKPAGKNTQVSVATKSKATPPPKPSRVGLSRAGSGGVNQSREDDTSPKGRSELMRKLSLRRMRIEEQIAGTARTASPSNSDISSNPGSTLESLSERNSGLSTSSTEVVVAYHSKKLNGDGGGEAVVVKSRSVTSPNGAPAGGGARQVIDEELEEVGGREGGTLAKFGIIEDISGGSYVV